MSENTITIPAALRTVIKRQAGERPQILLPEDMSVLLAGAGPEHQVEAEEAINRLIESSQRQLAAYDRNELLETKELVKQILLCSKPILTHHEAAEFLGVSQKRLNNILYEWKARFGRFPDFVCDAGGILQRRFIRDALIEWVKNAKKRRGRTVK
jgi:hypothetical protein